MNTPRTLLLAVGWVVALALAPCFAESERSHGAGDVSRHPETKEADRGKGDGSVPPPYGYSGRPPYYQPDDPYGRLRGADPATAHFWSEKCLRQRESGLSPWNHTRDCDNPAYSGSYGYPGYYPPYGGDVVIIDRNENRPPYPALPEPPTRPRSQLPEFRPPVRPLR